MSEIKNKNQAHAPKIKPFGAETFATSDKTIIRWLGNAGTFVNSQGTCIMIDPLLLSHWGSVDAPNMDAFNANPDDLYGLVENPERIYVLAPGEAFILHRLGKTEK